MSASIYMSSSISSLPGGATNMRRCEEETQVPKVARHYFDKNDDNRDNSKDYDDKFSHILMTIVTIGKMTMMSVTR